MKCMWTMLNDRFMTYTTLSMVRWQHDLCCHGALGQKCFGRCAYLHLQTIPYTFWASNHDCMATGSKEAWTQVKQSNYYTTLRGTHSATSTTSDQQHNARTSNTCNWSLYVSIYAPVHGSFAPFGRTAYAKQAQQAVQKWTQSETVSTSNIL